MGDVRQGVGFSKLCSNSPEVFFDQFFKTIGYFISAGGGLYILAPHFTEWRNSTSISKTGQLFVVGI